MRTHNTRLGHRTLGLLAAAGLASLATTAHADFVYNSFAGASDLTMIGAAQVDGSALQLTPAQERVVGATWYTGSKVSVGAGFETSFQYRIDDIHGAGADGFALVIQNESASAIGGSGGAMGYGNNWRFGETGITQSVAVEFDTWNNSPADWEDFNDNHVSVQTCGLLANDPDQTYSLNAATLPASPISGTEHLVRVVYVPGLLQVFLDGAAVPIVSADLDINSAIGLEDGLAWIGFTSATGGATDVERHEILNWSFTSVPTPGAGALLGLGAVLIGARRRR